jgi:hypothetical protein
MTGIMDKGGYMRGIVVLSLVVFLISDSAAYAHPPGRIRISHDKSSRLIKGKVFHAVTNPKSHFVKKVIVRVNKDIVIEHTMSLQEADSGQFLQYSIPGLEPGDIVRIETYCSAFGQLIEELKIKE